MKNIFTCLAVIIGTIIGAGFASGREILEFFNTHGNYGIFGIVLSSILFGIVTMASLLIIQKKQIADYKTLVNNNKVLAILLQIFSFMCFCIMISGVGAFAQQQLNFSFWYGTMIASVICYIMFLGKFRGIKTFNCIIVPLIIMGILIIGFASYPENVIVTDSVYNATANYTGNWFVAAILYSSYNSLVLVPILINFKNYNLKKSNVFIIGCLTTLVLGTLMFLIFRINNLFYPEIMNIELPNMFLASVLSTGVEIIYAFVMLVAIFSTAFSCGFSLLEMKSKENYERNALIMCVVAFVCARIGFSNMISIFFPIFGYLGVFQIILILTTTKSKEGKK